MKLFTYSDFFSLGFQLLHDGTKAINVKSVFDFCVCLVFFVLRWSLFMQPGLYWSYYIAQTGFSCMVSAR